MQHNYLVAPRYVKITHIPGEMSAGKEYQLECTAGGSNPPPLISWRLWDSSPLAGATQVVSILSSSSSPLAGVTQVVSILSFSSCPLAGATQVVSILSYSSSPLAGATQVVSILSSSSSPLPGATQ